MAFKLQKVDFAEASGVWRTVGGRRIFIKDGDNLETAMKKSGKFKYRTNFRTLPNKVKAETMKVERNASNEINEFKKEEVNEKDIRERSGLTEQETKECIKVAEEVYAEAERVEPQISRDLVDSAKNANSRMYGLDFRMKQPSSLAGKIGSDSKIDGVSFKEAGANIKDAVRYTAIIDEKNFTSGYNQMKSSLESKGYKEVRLKNFYKMYEEKTQCQKAIQCVYENKDGYKFELQYHTSNSQGAKELNHPLYEEYRKAGTSDNRRKELYNEMVTIGSYVNNPKGVLDIKEHK